MKYAVIQTGGKQYKVAEGDVIDVDKLEVTGNTVSFSDVLLFVSDDAAKVGNPHVPGVTVEAALLEQRKGEKIRVGKFLAKSRHRRVTGHRQQLSRVQINKIVSGDVKKSQVKVEEAIKTVRKPATPAKRAAKQ